MISLQMSTMTTVKMNLLKIMLMKMVGCDVFGFPIDDFYRNGELAKKFMKMGEKSAKENLGTVRGRIDRAFFSRGKEFSAAKKEEVPTKTKGVMDDGIDE